MLKPGDITILLERVAGGDGEAIAELVRLVEPELHKIADGYMRRERADHTLQATVLVDEAWIQLVAEHVHLEWENRRHFYRAAARAMRHLLIDYERRRRAGRRPPPEARQPLEALANAAGRESHTELISLDEALKRLAQLDPRQCEVVELHHFGGFTIAETARILGVSPSTVKGEWATAKAWLHRELSRGDRHS